MRVDGHVTLEVAIEKAEMRHAYGHEDLTELFIRDVVRVHVSWSFRCSITVLHVA